MDDLKDNIFLRAAFGGEIQMLRTSSSPNPRKSTLTNTTSDVERTSRKGKEKPVRRTPNAAHRKYSKLEDLLMLKAVKLKGRKWRAVLKFLKSNWEVLGEEGHLYRDCDIGDKSLQDRLRKRALNFLSKDRKSVV